MSRAVIGMRILTMVAVLTGVVFLLVPGSSNVSAYAPLQTSEEAAAVADARDDADSLAEDIILHNLFTPSRTAPNRRYGTQGQRSDPGGSGNDPKEPDNGGVFTPVLHGTAVADRPEAAKALLQLDPRDATPRLYGVGDAGGGYRVVSIEPRSVTLTGPRGRVVLRLPQSKEDNL